MIDRRASMADQASDLRRMVASISEDKRTNSSGFLRSIAVVGGKGGVGKSNISVNLALALGEMGHKVALLDGDLGLANVDILMGIQAPYNLIHLVRGERSLDEILYDVGDGVSVIPGGTGIEELANMDESAQSSLINALADLESLAEIMVVDTGAGIHRNMISFALSADTVILVTTPEPTSIRDAYGLLKSLVFGTVGKLDVRVLVNMVSSEEEARSVAGRMRFAASQFLRVDLGYSGYVLTDNSLSDSVRARKPLIRFAPRSDASRCFRRIARTLISEGGEENSVDLGRGVKSLFFKLARSLGVDRNR
ncbi:MinD/ParA family protein [Dethiosulfovibrio sp. F2B]|uniref:MinD/ParA family protein n=1 Tax=Dethiosulfovibrio faecalis TaxID=2720018 RepID=UPI001F3D6BD7|nr:MinD/ParA family protein [Dethiosulfovibrio faecalis]